MNEDYVSYEVAKLLKEKGFDSQYSTHFYKNERLECYMDDKKKYWLKKDEYAAPTLYVAQKWLREVKNIHITIYIKDSGWGWFLCKTNGRFITSSRDKGINGGDCWNIYEEALRAGISEALKLI